MVGYDAAGVVVEAGRETDSKLREFAGEGVRAVLLRRRGPMAFSCVGVPALIFPVRRWWLSTFATTPRRATRMALNGVSSAMDRSALKPRSPHKRKPMQRSKNGHLRLADRPADYKGLGIAPVEVAEFEDGQRIGMERGRYEWWYFDAHLDDGATVVVVFYTKPNVSPNGPLAPRITINITRPDGRIFDKVLDARPELFDASKSGCDVRIGTNRFVGDLHRYQITATIEEISVDIELTGMVRAWRPKSGHLYFGVERREKLFAWLPSVPNGLASVRYRIGNEDHRTSGSGLS